MRSVPFPTLYAAHRFGLVAKAGGTKRRRPAREVREILTSDRPDAVAICEFITSDGTVIARRVDAGGERECWLRADLADAAEDALRAEAEEHARIAAEVVEFSRAHDQRGADAAGMTLERYRAKRNHALARIDQRAGRNSVGLG